MKLQTSSHHPTSMLQNQTSFICSRTSCSNSSSLLGGGAPLVSTKYHRAAIDGYVDMLCQASKRDTNLADHNNDQLTPTLLASYHGQLEALRILVGKGGDPEMTTCGGLSALHLAVSGNHLSCVSFLVNFGVNMWALDNELHTAKDLAAMEQRKEILDYLDQMMAKQSAFNTKNVQKLKEKAKLGAEKRIKQMRKAQLKAIKQAEKDEKYLAKLSNNRRLLKSAHSISDIKLVGRGSSGGLSTTTTPSITTTNTDYSSSPSSRADNQWFGCSSSQSSTTGSSSIYSLEQHQQQHQQQLHFDLKKRNRSVLAFGGRLAAGGAVYNGRAILGGSTSDLLHHSSSSSSSKYFSRNDRPVSRERTTHLNKYQHQKLDENQQQHAISSSGSRAGSDESNSSSSSSASSSSSSSSSAYSSASITSANSSAVAVNNRIVINSFIDESSSSSSSGFFSNNSSGSKNNNRQATDRKTSTCSSSASNRPKYSDLVAVQDHELINKTTSTTSKIKLFKRTPSASTTTSNNNNNNNNNSIKPIDRPQANNSNSSSVASRLRGFAIGGGVSRKVQLKRLLLVNSQQLATTKNSCDEQQTSKENDSNHNHNHAKAREAQEMKANGLEDGTTTTTKTTATATKLCNVQPTIKLKLNASNNQDLGNNQERTNSHQINNSAKFKQHESKLVEKTTPVSQQMTHDDNNGTLSSGEGSLIKWPPPPSEITSIQRMPTLMSRAISEPDFSTWALLRDQEDSSATSPSPSESVHSYEDLRTTTDEEDDDEPALDSPSTTKNSTTTTTNATSTNLNVPQTSCHPVAASESAGGVLNKHLSSLTSPLHMKHQKVMPKETRPLVEDETNPQQSLLNQCLSQLKLRHENTMRNQEDFETVESTSDLESCNSIAKKQQQHQDTRVITSTPPSTKVSKMLYVQNDNSCELIQHQLNAGQFPLKPSLIKRQQQRQQLQLASQLKHQPSEITMMINGKSQQQIASSDSIGSASSLAKRNLRSTSPSKLSHTSCSSFNQHSFVRSPATCSSSSSFCSSVEAYPACRTKHVKLDNKQNNSESKKEVKKELEGKGETISDFLKMYSLEELSSVFAQECIDLEALNLLTEEDLKSLGILLGPRRKLLKALNDRHQLVANSKTNQSDVSNIKSQVDNYERNPRRADMYVMVDTPL